MCVLTLYYYSAMSIGWRGLLKTHITFIQKIPDIVMQCWITCRIDTFLRRPRYAFVDYTLSPDALLPRQRDDLRESATALVCDLLSFELVHVDEEGEQINTGAGLPDFEQGAGGLEEDGDGGVIVRGGGGAGASGLNVAGCKCARFLMRLVGCCFDKWKDGR